MRLFVLLFKETSMFCICMSFFFFFYIVMILFCPFLPEKREACVIFPALFFKPNPHELPSQIIIIFFFSVFAVASLRLEA